MHILGKKDDVMIVKRPFNKTGKKESELHSKIKEIEILFNTKNEDNKLMILSIFIIFEDGNDEYIHG